MGVLKNSDFNYGQLDTTTSDFLKQKETNMREIVGKAYTDLGRELKEAQDKLASQGSKYHGVFERWYTSMGWKKEQVYRIVRRYNLVTNCDEEKQDLIEDLPVSLTYEIAKPSADEGLKQKVLDGEVKSLKEFKELQKQKEEAEKRAKQLERSEKIARRKLEELENQEPKIETKVETRTEYIEVNNKKSEERLRKYEEKFGDIENYTERHTATNLEEVTTSVTSFSKAVRDLAKRHAYLIQYQHVIASLDVITREEYNEAVHALHDLSNDFKNVDEGSSIVDADYTILQY